MAFEEIWTETVPGLLVPKFDLQIHKIRNLVYRHDLNIHTIRNMPYPATREVSLVSIKDKPLVEF
jgi:hypothetical protein